MVEGTFFEDESGELRALLDALGDTLDPSILIGGWATWMRLGEDKQFFSRDIDLIIRDLALRGTLREVLDDYSESRHRGGMKVRGTVDGIHIDAYIPFESQLGDRLQLKVDELAKHVDLELNRGWSLLNVEAHVISKMAALLDRADSVKGEKDAREIMGFLFPDATRTFTAPDPAAAVRIIFDATAGRAEDVPGLVARVFDLLPETVNRALLGKKRRAELTALGKVWVNEARDQLARIQRQAGAANGASPQRGPQLRRGALGQPGNKGEFATRDRTPGDVEL